MACRPANFVAVAVLAVVAVLGGCGRAPSQPLPEAVPDMPAGPRAAAFPLTKRDGHRCLADQAGKDFLVQGDAAWSLLVQLRREDAAAYLEDRARRGFNTLLVNLIEHHAASHPPRNAYGDLPFLAGATYERPNEKYFAHVDWVLQQAAERGFLVLLAPSYLGFEGGEEGWYKEMRAAGRARLQAYGKYLGTRYGHMANIVWVHGGDYNAPDRSLVEAVMEGMKDADPRALHTFHGSRGTSARDYLVDGSAWLGLDTIYTDENGVVAAAGRAYGEARLPFILIEGRYEDMGATPAMVRAQAYQAVLSGACGQVFGNKYIWPFVDGWKQALDSPGSRSMTRLRGLVEGMRWPALEPQSPGLVVSGAGSGVQQAAIAVTKDRRRAILYSPRGGALVLDASRLPGTPASMQWHDPTQERMVPARPAFSAASRELVVDSPGLNAAGDEDWVLAIEFRQQRK